jgi:hypothetical protein
MAKSSCVIYDSRLLHCGSANRSFEKNQSRAIFYFSFRHPEILYPGNPPSIRNDLRLEQITLENLVNTMRTIQQKDGMNPFHF